MTTNTLSHLSKGYGSWTAGHVNPYFGDSKHGHHELPEIIEPDSHFHGVTVGSRSGRSTAMSYASPRKHRDHREPINDQIPLSKSYTVNSDRAPLPKTYTTRKGALQIYVAPGDMEADEPGYELRPKYVQVKRPHGKELIDLSLKLGTIERLAMSVLQFGDEDYDHEHSSVTDDKNKAFLKFLRSVDEGEKCEPEVDRTVQPGGDLHNYLRDLRSSASGRYGEGGTHLSKHHEARELQAILRGLDANSGWPLSYSQDGMSDRQSSGQFTRPVSRVSSRGPSPVYWRKLWLHRPPSTPRSSYRVLSARKVAASIKSGTYLGRPGSRVSTNDDDVTPSDLRTSSPPQVTAATTSNLKQQWTPTDSTDKRATRNANANARKGEGQNVPEVKVTGKSDAGSQGKGQGQKMAQIAEEHGDGAVLGPSALYDDYDADDDDDDYFARRAAEAERLARANADGADRQGILLGRSGVINIDIEGQLKRLGSRPGSGLSDSSGSSYTSTHTPSIITIQNLKRAQKAQQRLANEKFSSPRKRRPISHEHERSKARVQSSHGDRHSSKLVQDETFDGAIGISIAAPTPENTNGGQFAYGGNMTWNMDEAIPAEISDDAEQYVDNKPPEFESANNELDLDGAREESSDYEGQGQIDNLVTDQDEYDAEHLQECNDEIKQIEAKVEAAIAESDNGNYRDSSLLDEEAIKVIQESQNQGESQGQARSGPGSIKSRMSGIGKESIIEDNSEVRSEVSRSEVSRSEVGSKMSKPSLTRQSAIDLDTDGDLDEKVEGQIAEETEFEVTEQEKEDEQGGGVSRADLESQQGPRDGDSSGDSAGVVLPALDSDKLPANQQKSGSQTGFSGSTDSYSDMLATEKTSRPVSGASARQGQGVTATVPSDIKASQPTSSPVSSRPTSSARPSSRPSSVTHQGQAVSRPSSGTRSRSGSRPSSAAKLSRPFSKAEVSRPASKAALDDSEKDQVTVVEPEVKTLVQDQKVVSVDTGDAGIKQEVSDASATKGDVAEPNKQANEAISKQDEGVKDLEKSLAESSKPETVIEKTVEPEPVQPTHLKDTIEVKTEADILKDALKSLPTPSPPPGPKQRQRAPIVKKTRNTTTKPVRGPAKRSATPSKTPEPSTGAKTPNLELSSKALDSLSKVDQGVGDLDELSEAASKVDATGEGLAKDVGVDKQGEKDAHDIVKELDALGLNKPVDKKKKKKDGSSGLTYPLAPPGKRPQAPPEQAKIPDHIVEALNRQPVESILKLEEDLERRGFLYHGSVTDMVGESLSGHTLEAIGEGLTEEELQLAKQLLQQKIDEAKGKLDNKEPGTDTGAKSAIGGKKKATGGGKGAVSGGKTGKGGKGKRKGKQTEPERTQEDIDREAIRLKHEEEKRIRDEESAELQRKIAEKRALLQAQNDANSVESKKLREKMLELEKEADNLMQAEDEARSILAGVHKQKREEREARRKADLEKKKRDAHDRRERERKELEEKRKKEEEMLEKIADGEMRRQAREEEERKAEEEERMAQERYEAELRDAARHEEEEEERLKDIERAAEEEAMQKLIEEREAAERERRMLREEAEQRMEEERLETERIIEEQMSLERERQRLLEIENAKREQQRLNLIELRRLEEEARAKMQEEIAKRRADALARRDINLENRMHVDKLKHYQGITRAWTFSYFVHWPRETYERRMGADPKKKRPRFPPKKKTAEPGAEQVAGSEQDKEAAAPNAQSALTPAQSQ